MVVTISNAITLLVVTKKNSYALKNMNINAKKNNIADDAFVHIDIPLTFEHQCDLLRNAGFVNIKILYQNDSTVIIRGEKRTGIFE